MSSQAMPPFSRSDQLQQRQCLVTPTSRQTLGFTVWMNLLQMTFLSPLPSKRNGSLLKITAHIDGDGGGQDGKPFLAHWCFLSFSGRSDSVSGCPRSPGATSKTAARWVSGPATGLTLILPGMGLTDLWGRQRYGHRDSRKSLPPTPDPGTNRCFPTYGYPSEAFLMPNSSSAGHPLPTSVLTNLLQSCRRR